MSGPSFFGIPLDRVMTYEDGRKVLYSQHVENLMTHLFPPVQNPNGFNLTALPISHNLIMNLLWFDTCALWVKGTVACNVLSVFCTLDLRKWAMEVIKDARQGRNPDNSGFYPNLIFDWGTVLDAIENPSDKQTILRFVVAGLNGRRCCNGEKPGPAFVSTTRLVEMHDIMSLYWKDHPAQTSAQTFLAKYRDLLEFSPLVEAFNRMMRSAGVDITFEKKFNEETGANAYNIIDARVDYVKKNNPMLANETLDQLANVLTTIDLTIGKDRQNGFAASVVKWNLSEYVSRAVCACPTDYKGFDTPFVNEIVERSMHGTFPGAEVNADVLSTPMSFLYFLE
jgi:hypothetical protein